MQDRVDDSMTATTSVAAAPAAYPKLASASGIIGLLGEGQVEVQCQAVRMLDSIVDYFWPEISDVSSRLEHFAYDEKFPERHLAALVLAKVLFNEEQWEDAIRMTLMSGPLFNIRDQSIFTRTMLGKAIDKYVGMRAAGANVPASLEAIVFEVIGACLRDEDYEQVVGIALDAGLIDVLKGALDACEAGGKTKLLKYAQQQVLSHGCSLEFQKTVLNLLVETALAMEAKDLAFICDCLISTQDIEKISELLKGGDDELVALQIAFNLYEASPELATKVSIHIEDAKLASILSGRMTAKLSVQFLAEKNHSDMLILEKTKSSLNHNSSQHHSALYYANGLMQCGTTNDELLRGGMEWVSHASNWAKFSAAASLGMIHSGHVTDSKTILAPYLPKPGLSTTSEYTEGGALFALGLIHARTESSEEIAYLQEKINGSEKEVVQHGACLGIGAAAMASCNPSIMEDLKGILYGDSATSGEAAGIALGLVMAGSADAELAEELLAYARETEHEKIVRSVALGVALIMYGARDKAIPTIDAMMESKDATIRYGAAWTIAMAYAGTSDNSAVRRLLHAAVSESDDNVRRAAVISLGFVMFRNGRELPQLLSLLAASYNPHVRYGVAMALGIALSGTADPAALSLLLPLTKDLTDFCRQAAHLSLSLLLQQVSEAASEHAAPTRKLLESVAGNKYEDAMARFGAILGQGMIDAGGRNAALTLSCPSAPQHNSLPGIVGAMLGCQFWYWYPCTAFWSLALQPTCLLALDGPTLLPLHLSVSSSAPPSLHAYPPPTKPAESSAPKLAPTTAAAVLSTTAKTKARAARKALDSTDMDVDASASQESLQAATTPEDTKAEVEAEPGHQMIENMSRVTRSQVKHILFSPTSDRFLPVQPLPWTGPIITILRDTQPHLPLTHIKPATDDDSADKTMAIDKLMAPAPEPLEDPDF